MSADFARIFLGGDYMRTREQKSQVVGVFYTGFSIFL